MPKYTKLSPADFRRKLKNGDYESLTGAKRAIGKMQEWSDGEREKARTASAKHFGDAAPPPSKKTSKKKAAKKTAKKAAKKAGPGPGLGRKKKTAKKPAKAAKAAKPAKAAKAAKAVKAVKKTAPKRKGGKKPAADVEASIENTRNAVQAYAEAVDVLKKCQGQGGESVVKGLEKAAEGVTKLIDAMDASIVQPLMGQPPTPQEMAAAERFRQASAGAVTPNAPAQQPGNGGLQAPAVQAPPVAAAAAPGPVTPPPAV